MSLGNRAAVGMISVLAGCSAPPGGDAETATSSVTHPLQVGDWTYTPLTGTRCLDGSPNTVGVGFRPAPQGSPNANKLLVHVDGGGACFNKPSCDLLVNTSYDGDKFADEVDDQLTQGIFDRSLPWLNPVDDWNHVFIPYCTGDLHAGSNPSGDVAGVGDELHFVGYDNMTIILSHVVDTILPTLGTNRRVIFSGESAGGSGVMLNAHRFRAMLPSDVTLSVVSDSAPLFGNPPVPSLLQSTVRSLWNLDSTFLSACGSACSDPGSWMGSWRDFVMGSNPSVRFGLVSSNGDSTIRFAYGLKNAGCNDSSVLSALIDPDCYISKSAYNTGLSNVRAAMQASASAHPGLKTATFFLGEGGGYEEQHQWIAFDRFYSLSEACEQGVCMNSWFNDIADDVPTFRHIGP